MITQTQALSRTNHQRTSGKGWLLAAAVSLAVSLTIVAPFFIFGSASGHDFEFHVASWLDAAGQWKEGIAFPRWTEWANHGFGEPRFIFYPPVSWMLGAALGFVLPWSYVPVAFIVLTQSIAGLGAFALARRVLGEPAAMFAAAFYVANPYALLVIYMRSDYAELLASAFLPLFFFAALELADVWEYQKRCTASSIAIFAALFGTMWICNAPAGVLASYSAALLFAWAGIERKSWRPLVSGAGGLLLGLGLASFYLVPAAYEQRWVNIAQALSSGLLPSENFLYTATNDPEHNLFNWIASSVAILMIVVTGIAALAARRESLGARDNVPREGAWKILLVTASAATFFMIRISAIFWTILPKLKFVQFPWRWMAILAVPFAYFLGAAVAGRRIRWVWMTAVAAILCGNAVFLARATWWDADDAETLHAAVETGQGFDGTDEYDPLGDDHYELPLTAPPVKVLQEAGAENQETPPSLAVDRWTAEDKEVRVYSREPVRLALRLLNYPAWQIKINGMPARGELEMGETRQMILPIPAGNSRVSVRFSRTLDRTLGGAATLLSVMIVSILLIAGERRQRS